MGFVDADYANGQEGKSYTGYVSKYGDGPIS